MLSPVSLSTQRTKHRILIRLQQRGILDRTVMMQLLPSALRVAEEARSPNRQRHSLSVTFEPPALSSHDEKRAAKIVNAIVEKLEVIVIGPREQARVHGADLGPAALDAAQRIVH